METTPVEHINDLLQFFCTANAIPSAKLGASGTCSLKHSSGIGLCLELSSDGTHLHWYTRLSRVPFEDREIFYQHLLRMNLLCQETRGGTLGLDNDSMEIVFSYTEEVRSLDATRFHNASENFLTTALAIQENLSSENELVTTPDDDDTSSFLLGIRA